MPVRRLPVRPDPEQLHRQAKELLRAIHAGDANGIAELREYHPESIDPAATKLADAQLVRARSYGASSLTRLVQAGQLADATWRDARDKDGRPGRRHPRPRSGALTLTKSASSSRGMPRLSKKTS